MQHEEREKKSLQGNAVWRVRSTWFIKQRIDIMQPPLELSRSPFTSAMEAFLFFPISSHFGHKNHRPLFLSLYKFCFALLTLSCRIRMKDQIVFESSSLYKVCLSSSKHSVIFNNLASVGNKRRKSIPYLVCFQVLFYHLLY